MIVDELYKVIASEKPQVIYLSGKTSTGKSTFARMLQKHLQYAIVELEAVLLEVVNANGFDEQSTFHKVLREDGPSSEKDLFFEATDKSIVHSLKDNDRVVIEGAVSNLDTLKRVLQVAPRFMFVYFHPTDIDIYIRNLTSRFLQSDKDVYSGLPLKFWQLVDEDEFDVFCRTRQISAGLEYAIKTYALESQSESKNRLHKFEQHFTKITVVEIQ